MFGDSDFWILAIFLLAAVLLSVGIAIVSEMVYRREMQRLQDVLLDILKAKRELEEKKKPEEIKLLPPPARPNNVINMEAYRIRKKRSRL